MFVLMPGILFAAEPFDKPGETYCCDYRDSSTKCVEIVKKCDPGAVEISADAHATIKIGYRYIGEAPVYIRIKDCPKGTVLPIIVQPGAKEAAADPRLKEQISEFTCGNYEPVRIHFDMKSGLRTFAYYEYPKDCSTDGCAAEKEKVPEKWRK